MLSSIILKTIFYIVSFLISVISARMVSIADIGSFAILFSICNILIIIFGFGLDTTIIKIFSSNVKSLEYEFDTIIGDRIILQIILSPLIFLILYLYSDNLMLSLMATLIVFCVLIRNMISNLFLAKRNIIKGLFLQEGIQSITRFSILLSVFIFLIIIQKENIYNINILYIAWLVGVLLSFIISVFIYTINNFESYNIKGAVIRLFCLIKDSKNFWLSQIIWLTIPYIDILIISKILNYTDVAGYDTAAKIAAAGVFFSSVTQSVIAPKISNIWNGGKIEELLQYLKKVSVIFVMLSLISFLFFYTLGTQILLIWGSDFVPYYEVLLIVALSQLLKMTFGPLSSLLQMSGYSNLELRVALLNLPIKVITSIVLGIYFGVIGIAISVLISTLLSNTVLFAYSKKILRLKVS
ncbi:oligosaccharide flippase family protein [Photobacterium leiognathi]|uniref:oligosaccharide flippase family protein n=1 Tax=Photobacterium leiognathi TaxID=553611 RepID=UPI002980DAD8|nr:oligosaccharide flippase family protein [Photobacterium leiognathi]